jgi:uncharacterized protein DUF6282
MSGAAPTGIWDAYCHTAPCVLPRWGSAVDVAAEAAAHSFGGVVLQSHHEGTLGRAAAAAQAVPGIRVLGGVTLNEYCGGLSVKTVRAHLLAGARIVWLPTTDSAAHAKRFGGTGRSTTGAFDPSDQSPGIGILAGDDLEPTVVEVLHVLAASGGVLCTGHLSMEEIDALIGPARRLRVPLVINHPYFIMHPTDEWWERLPSDGVFAQFAAVDGSADFRLPPLDRVRRAMSILGPARCMLGSEARAPVNPVQRLVEFCRTLEAAGVSKRDVEIMACDTPQQLFGGDAGAA